MSLFISPQIMRLIEMALEEDDVGADVTSRAFFRDEHGAARLVAKQDMVVCGLGLASAVLARVDDRLEWEPELDEGARAKAGDVIARLSGPTVALLEAERTLLNFMQRMSGVATLTARYVEALGNERIRLADTRKTLPGWRALDKYAVRVGGGANHRHTLASGVMLKDNHIAAAGDLQGAVERARRGVSHMLKIEVEVETLEQVGQALASGADIIMLDNMSIEQMVLASAQIRSSRPEVIIEVSGNVTLERLGELGKLDVDVISTGAITHSAPAADISMRWE